MRITVRSVRHRFCLRLPSCLIFSGLVASVIGKYIIVNEPGMRLTGKQIRPLFRIIRRLRKQLPDWNLVEITEASGEGICIRL